MDNYTLKFFVMLIFIFRKFCSLSVVTFNVFVSLKQFAHLECLGVHWLRLCTSIAKGAQVQFLVGGTKILHATWCGQENKEQIAQIL